MKAGEVAVVDADHRIGETHRAFEFGLVMHLDEHIHAVMRRRRRHLGCRIVIEHGKDQQHRIGAERARFGDLPDVYHEILAQSGQAAGGAGSLEKRIVTLEIVAVGQHRQAGGASAFVRTGDRSGIKTASYQSLGGRCSLDFCDNRDAVTRFDGYARGKTARRVALGDPCLQLDQRARTLADRDVGALGPANFGKLAHE